MDSNAPFPATPCLSNSRSPHFILLMGLLGKHCVHRDQHTSLKGPLLLGAQLVSTFALCESETW